MTHREQLLQEAGQIRRAGFTDTNRGRFDEIMGEIETMEQRPAPDETRRLTGLAGLDDRYAEDLIARGITLRETRDAIIGEMARRQTPEISRHIGTDIGDGATTQRLLRLQAEALAARFGGPAPSNEAREFMHMRVADFAREALERRGVHTRGMAPSQLITRAMHTSGDFPVLLQETGDRTLRAAYASYQGGVRRICRQSTARDFKAKSKLMLGQAPALLRVTEHGEVTHGTMAEAKASYSLATFARIFGITRQALVNDDLGAFVDFAARMGRAAAELVSAELVTLLTSNPLMDDGVALFDAAHANVGTPGAISLTTLGEGLKLMRLQTGLDGVTPIDATPRYLVVPATLEVLAKQYVRQINAAKSADVNPFVGDLDIVIDPRLDAASVTAWYLAADPGTLDTIEYSYLEDETGPVIETRAGFEVEGVEVKVRLDFGCGVIDHRGLVRNAG